MGKVEGVSTIAHGLDAEIIFVGRDIDDQEAKCCGGGERQAAGLLGPVDELLADLVKRGQDSDVFAQHLPAGILSQVAYGVVFAIADSDLSNGTLGARAATITSLLMLGVPETRAIALVGDQP